MNGPNSATPEFRQRNRRRRRAALLIAPIVAALALSVTVIPASAAAPGPIRLVSHVPASPLTTSGQHTYVQAASSDGGYVAFTSRSGGMVAGQADSNAWHDVFVWERATGTIMLVSHIPGSTTTTGNAPSEVAAISDDGAYVAFVSHATNLVTGQTDFIETYDLFLWERATGTVRLISHAANSASTTVGADGSYTAFDINATGSSVVWIGYNNVVAGLVDGNGSGDVFLYDRATGANSLVSRTPASPTTTANEGSHAPSISADGAYVAFQSSASNLVTGQVQNFGGNVFLWSRATGAMTLVSHAAGSSTTTANEGGNGNPVISADGNWVAYWSSSNNLVAGQVPMPVFSDLYLFERATGTNRLVSHVAGSAVTEAGMDPNSPPSLSADASYVAFRSDATNLVAGQLDGVDTDDVFVYERASGTNRLVSHIPASATTTTGAESIAPVISADGSSVAFLSTASNLVPGQNDTNNDHDVFLFHRPSGRVSLVSHVAGSATTTGATVGAWEGTIGGISANGRYVTFGSNSTDHVAGQSDTFATLDVFQYQRPSSGAGGDYDADGDADVAVFRPASGTWFVQGGLTTAWGTSGDLAIPGDYDGDGDTDVAVFRPATGTWFVQGGLTTAWGTSGDIPIPGDYDGDGDTDVAVFRPASGTWFVQGGLTTAWGTSGDIPVPGDYDGDGDTDVAVFRPASGTWFVQGGLTTAWGTNGDIPVPGDYDGDGDTDVAVFRPATGTWFVQGGLTTAWGTSGDIPVPADYDGDGDTDVAVFRPASGTWFVQGGLTTAWGTSGDVALPLAAAIQEALF